jgi:hypothetical protein
MHMRPISISLSVAAALILALSCATPPKPAPAPEQPAPAPAQVKPAPAPAVEEGVPAPDDLRAKAAELKKKAFDLGLKDLLAPDYAEADGLLAQGNASYGKDNKASAAAFADAVSRFEELIAKGLPLLAERERQNAAQLRDSALGKGAADSFADLLAPVEANWDKAGQARSSGDFEGAIALYRASAREYEVMYKLCDAKKARDSILARDFAKWDPSNWNLAEARYAATKSLLPQDAKAAAASVDEALLRYSIAFQTALEYYAGDRQKSSVAARERATGIKAQVAVKDEYAQALDLFDKAEAARAAKDFEGSASLYDRSAASFASAYSHAKVKMDSAKGELDSLDSSLAAAEAASTTSR